MIELRIQLLAMWHPGTGRGQGPGADAEANRDAAGLPHVPGKTLKGLLRDGAEIAADLGHLSRGDLEAVFGTPFELPDAPEPARHRSGAGSLRVYSARVGRTVVEARCWQAWARKEDGAQARRHLFRTIATTSLDAAGIAEDHSLRSIEVVVPVALSAEVHCTEVDEALGRAVLNAAVPFVNALGAHRTRGLGRCVVTVVPKET